MKLQYSLSSCFSGWRLNVTFLVTPFVWFGDSHPSEIVWGCGFLLLLWSAWLSDDKSDILYIFCRSQATLLDCICRSWIVDMTSPTPCEHLRVRTNTCSTTKQVTWDHVRVKSALASTSRFLDRFNFTWKTYSLFIRSSSPTNCNALWSSYPGKSITASYTGHWRQCGRMWLCWDYYPRSNCSMPCSIPFKKLVQRIRGFG